MSHDPHIEPDSLLIKTPKWAENGAGHPLQTDKSR